MTTAINTVGAANFARVDQFAWWKSEANARQHTQAPNPAQGGERPGPHRRRQRRRRRLAREPDHLPRAGRPARERRRTRTRSSSSAAPGARTPARCSRSSTSTRRRTTSPSTTSTPSSTVASSAAARRARANPLQSRNNATTRRPRTPIPSFLYGELVSQYLSNFKTRVQPGDATPSPTTRAATPPGTAITAKRLQVPYLIGYKGNGGRRRPTAASPVSGSSKNGRQPRTREYMSQWWLHQPAARASSGSRRSRRPLRSGRRSTPSWRTSRWQTDPATLLPEHGDRHRRRAVPRRHRHGDGDLHTANGRRDRRQRRRQPDHHQPGGAVGGAGGAGRVGAGEPRRGEDRLIVAERGGDAGPDADRQPDARSSVPGASPQPRKNIAHQRLGHRHQPGQRRRRRWPPSARWTSSSAACRVASSRRAP